MIDGYLLPIGVVNSVTIDWCDECACISTVPGGPKSVDELDRLLFVRCSGRRQCLRCAEYRIPATAFTILNKAVTGAVQRHHG